MWKVWNCQIVVAFVGIGIHGAHFGKRLDPLKISADGSSATKTDFPWPTVAGRFRACESGPDGNL